MVTYTLSLEDLTRNANIVKESLIARLEEDGLLDTKHHVAENYCIVLVPRRTGILGFIFERLTGTETEADMQGIEVKVLHR